MRVYPCAVGHQQAAVAGWCVRRTHGGRKTRKPTRKGLANSLILLGGAGRSRTDLLGFAIRCITALLPRRVWSTQKREVIRTSLFQRYGAGNRSRTGDLNLGKVALYQLSYSRVLLFSKDQNYSAKFAAPPMRARPWLVAGHPCTEPPQFTPSPSSHQSFRMLLCFGNTFYITRKYSLIVQVLCFNNTGVFKWHENCYTHTHTHTPPINSR